MGRMSLPIDNEGRITDPEVAELVEISQLGWAAQDAAGIECSVARPNLATAKQLSPEDYSRIDHFRGTTDTAFALLDKLLARPGMSPAVVSLAAEIKEGYARNRPERDAVYRQLDGSGHEVMSIADWRKVCTNPVFTMIKLTGLTEEMISDHAKVMAARGSRLLWGTALALAVAVLLCGAGIVLVSRRVARPVDALTATIERLARRDYAEAVARSGREDEFDTMAAALETLRKSGLEGERMAAAQLAAKEEELQTRPLVEAACRNSTTRSARCWTRSTPPARLDDDRRRHDGDRREDQAPIERGGQRLGSGVGERQCGAGATEELSASVSEIGRQVNQWGRGGGGGRRRMPSGPIRPSRGWPAPPRRSATSSR